MTDIWTKREAELLRQALSPVSRHRLGRMLRNRNRTLARGIWSNDAGDACLYEAAARMLPQFASLDKPSLGLYFSLWREIQEIKKTSPHEYKTSPLIDAWDQGLVDYDALAEIFDPTPKEDDVLPPRMVSAFTGQVRFMDKADAAQAYANGDWANLNRILRGNKGLLEQFEFYGRALPRLDEPIHIHKPGESTDAARISYLGIQRWNHAATNKLTAIRASEKLINIYGGTRVRVRGHESHDLMVARVFARYGADSPDLIEQWLSEDQYGETDIGEKRPDARMGDRIIEVVGAYPKSRVEALVELADEEGKVLELW